MEDSKSPAPHIALLPSSGMGHLTPFLRLAAAFDSRNCTVTLINILPIVSLAESSNLSHFFSAYPRIRHLDFKLLPFDASTTTSTDPFFLQFEAIRRSLHLLPPLLSTSPPLSALISDITLTYCIVNIQLPFPKLTLFTSSAAMLALCAFLPTVHTGISEDKHPQLDIPGIPAIPISDIPQPLLLPNNPFKTEFIENGLALVKSDGIVVNTFHALEPDTLDALNHGTVFQGLPKVVPLGPLEPCQFECGSDGKSEPIVWLDAQPARSVIYVSFGSRTALSLAQIKEVASGLERSGYRFLWVVKSKKVDKEDEAELEELIETEFLERVKERGLVVKSWVQQWEVLRHPAIGAFVSHCGWNSLTEAVWHGVPVLAWPQLGDQRINAGIVERSGLGLWDRSWEWGGNEAKVVVTEKEICVKLQELMTNKSIGNRAAYVGEAARRAVAAGGTSFNGLTEVLEKLTL